MLLFTDITGKFHEDAVIISYLAKEYLKRLQQNEKKETIPSIKKDENLSFLFRNTELKRKKGITVPTDADTFKALVTKDYFIDKSLLIRDIIEGDTDHILITRPRRWGKTLNMDMLKTFLEIEVNKNGDIKLQKNNQNYFNGTNTQCQPEGITY